MFCDRYRSDIPRVIFIMIYLCDYENMYLYFSRADLVLKQERKLSIQYLYNVLS